jgi:hypothetical protein
VSLAQVRRGSRAAARRRIAAAGWDPSQVPGLVAYWNADDLTGANGASIASWTDRKAGITVNAGTSQPTLVASSGSTGHQALRFTAANSQIMTAPRGAIPNQAPVWVWVVHRMATQPSQPTVVEVATPATNNGWLVGYTGATPQVGGWTIAFYGSGGDPAATNLWRAWSWDPTTEKAALTQRDNRASAVGNTNITTNAVAGGTTLSVGGSSAKGTFYLDSEIQLILIGSGTRPGAADMRKMADWLWGFYGIATGTQYNAPNYVATAGKNYDGTAATTAIELSVLYKPTGLFGHNYWLAFDPYSNSNVANENPHVAYSDDGNTWTTIPTQPVVAYPGGGNAGNNADCALFDNTARDGLLYLYFTREQASPASANGVFYCTSSDGVTWSAPTQTKTGAQGYSECPTVVYDAASSKYWLYTMTLATSGVQVVRQTSANPTGPWSAEAACSLTLPGGAYCWHMGTPVLIGSKWVMATSDRPGNYLWLLSSPDGMTWTCATRPVVVPGVSNWDNQGLYRPAIQDAQDGTNLLLWYVVGLGGNNQLSQKVTVPLTEIL